MSDAVNHPAHYGGKEDPYEVIKVAEAWGFDNDAYLFNVLKYIRRDKDDWLADLEKARFYLDRRIERLKQQKNPEKPPETIPLEIVIDRLRSPSNFNKYTVLALSDWTIGRAADAAAAKSGGSYTLALYDSGDALDPLNSVRWLTGKYPPALYDYCLMEI